MAFIIIRCFILYFVIMLSVRMMGKRQIGELQPIELVITILISELASMPIQDPEQPILAGILPIFTLAGIEILVSLLTLKSIRLRYLLYGKPIVMIYQGKILQKQMEKARVSVDDLIEAMRSNGISNIEEIEFAVLETDGNLSIIKKEPSTEEMPEVAVIDGQVINRKLMPKSRMSGILRAQGMKSVKDIFLMTVDSKGKTYIIKKEKRK